VTGPVFAIWPVAVFPVGTEVTKAAREIGLSPVRWNVLSFEVNGLGAPASQILRDEIIRRRHGEEALWLLDGGSPIGFRGPVLKHNPTTTTWERKADGLGRLRLLAEAGQVVFQRDETFMRQLASARVEHRQHSVGIEAPPGAHDDLVDAAYIATGVHGRSGLRNVLADLARQRLPSPPDLPEPGGTVETEGGLVLPRRPHLISVAGVEVTPPVGVDPSSAQVNPVIERARGVLTKRKESVR
jgi:hypothetical protein